MSAARDRPAARAHGCSGLQGLMVPPSRDGSPLYDTASHASAKDSVLWFN